MHVGVYAGVPRMPIADVESLTHRFGRLAQAAGFDQSQDFYRQEIPIILKKSADNPGLTWMDAVKEHCRLRGFSVLEGRSEHDASHILVGLIYHCNLEAGLLRAEDHVDFQTGNHVEVFANDIESKLFPDGVLANWHRDHPEELVLNPHHPGIITSVENEENYYRTLCWIIGGSTGHRAANIRYVSGANEEDQRFRGQNQLEGIVQKLGYAINYNKEGDFKEVSWSIAAPDGTVYFCDAQGKRSLPQGSNGVEVFRAFNFANERMVNDFYNTANSVINYVHLHRRGRTVQETLNSVSVAELVAVIRTAAGVREMAPASDGQS